MYTQNVTYIKERTYVNTSLVMEAYTQLFSALENGMDWDAMSFLSNQYNRYSHMDIALDNLFDAYAELWISAQDEISTEQYHKLKESFRNIQSDVESYLSSSDNKDALDFQCMPFGDYMLMVDDLLQFDYCGKSLCFEADFAAQCHEAMITPQECATDIISTRSGSLKISV